MQPNQQFPQPTSSFWQNILQWPLGLKLGLSAVTLILLGGGLWLAFGQTPQPAPQPPTAQPGTSRPQTPGTGQNITEPEAESEAPSPTGETAAPGGAATPAAGNATPPPTSGTTTTPPPPGGGTTPPPAGSTRPDASNTGPAAGTVFTLYGGSGGHSSSNLTYDGVRFPEVTGSPFYYQFYGNNLTFKNCNFEDGVIFYGDNVRVENCLIKGGVSFSGSANGVLDRNNIFEYADGIHVTSDSGQVTNLTISNNYVHHPAAVCGSHTDGLQVRGINGLTVTNNAIDIGPEQIVCGEGIVNAAIYLEDDNGGNSNVTIAGNYLNGGGYIVRLQHTVNLRITSNRFGPDMLFDFIEDETNPGDVVEFTGNVVDATGAPINL